ncbi:MAG: amino acid carrier protein [Planctomycetota bacterium]
MSRMRIDKQQAVVYRCGLESSGWSGPPRSATCCWWDLGRKRPLAVHIHGWVALACLTLGIVVGGAVQAAPEQSVEAERGSEQGTGDLEGAGSASSDPEADSQGAWMDRVDARFGDYLVAPLEKTLFYDFGTQKMQLRRLRKQDTGGDGYISREEARGTVAAGFEALDKNQDGRLSEEEFSVLAPKVPAVVAWLLLGGIFFTLRMGFINFRGFWHAIRLTKGDYDDTDEDGEVSHFQALSSALSATVGLGNIAGVAIAVGSGGPGAIFWLIVAGFFGMSTKFCECTLGQMYRKVEADGTISGGPMHYLKAGFREVGWGWLGMTLATVYAVICVGASFGGGCAFQVGQSLGPLKEQIPLLESHPWVYGVVMAVLVGVVIIGGIRRIAATAARIVPLMCTIYVAMALAVLLYNHADILPAFGLIFSKAFTANAVFGGFLGVAVIGIKRAVFSNEAGIGSASIAHAAAKTNEPVSEGIVALLEPFIDTVVVCTMTGLVIVITGVYEQPEYAGLVADNDGAALTSQAMGTVSSWFPKILCLAVMLFAYSTMISWSYYGERCWSLLFGVRTSMIYKCLFLVFVLLGSVVTATNVKNFADLMILSLAFPNILGVVILSGRVRGALDQYWAKYQRGELKLVK